MAHAAVEAGYASGRTRTSVSVAHRRPTFAQAVILAIALSIPVWAGLIYCAVRLL